MKIKKCSLLLLTVFFILSFSSCGGKTVKTSNEPLKPKWKVVSSITNELKVTIAGFNDEKCGIAVGRDGTTHYTDKGFNKLRGGSGSQKACLFGLCIINNKVAYACGNGSTVVKTLDGGANWQEITDFGTSEPSHARYLSFVDENSGWIAMPQDIHNTCQLARTMDGGKTWTGINLPNDINAIMTIYLRDSSNGYILDKSNILYTTHDGGKSFSKQKINIDDMFDFSSLAFLPYSQQVALRFLDEKNAIIAYIGKNKKLKVARSSDGGVTWLNEPVEDVKGGAIYISSDGKIISLVQNDGFYDESKPHNNIRILEYK